MKWILTLMIIFSPVVADAGIKEVMNASCKITTNKGSGSGIVFKKDVKSYYILTAGHVVSGANTYNIQFYRKGKIGSMIPAKLVMLDFSASTIKDIAVLSIDVKTGSIEPIPVVPTSHIAKPNDLIYGAGCPEGKWLQYWEGNIISVDEVINFNMAPIGGQSGSGVVTAINGKDYVLGLVNWRVETTTMYGSGVLIRNKNKTSKVTFAHTPVENKWSVDEILKDENRCKHCGLYKSQHYSQIVDGQRQLFCPRCLEHGLRFKDHLIGGMKVSEFCGPEGCFPFPNNQTPNNNFNFDEEPLPDTNEDDSEEISALKAQIDELLSKIGILEKDQGHVLDEATGGYGNAVERFFYSIIGFIFGLISKTLKSKLGTIPGTLATWWLKRKGKQVIENIQKPVEKKVTQAYSTIDESTQTVPNSVTNNIYMNGNKEVAPYFQEFFEHKEKDGEKVEDWALFGILYKEAVDLLRNGRLFFNEKEGVILQGQIKTADVIDDWVKNQFIFRSSLKQIMNKNTAYNEAMMGFLYKEAILELRKGSFGVLGAEDTANAIDRWVKSEFLKRLNIK